MSDLPMFKSKLDEEIASLKAELEAVKAERDILVLHNYKPKELCIACHIHQRLKLEKGTLDGEYNKFKHQIMAQGIYKATNHIADNNDLSYMPAEMILELAEQFAEQLKQQAEVDNELD